MKGGIYIGTLTEFKEYEKMLLGYIRINALTDKDYHEIAESILNAKLSPPQNANLLEWLRYKADSFIFDYYYSKEKQHRLSGKGVGRQDEEREYYSRLKHKCMDLYVRISESETVFESKYKKRYKFPYSPGEEDILYDVIFVFEEVLQDLLSINLIESRPHEKLIFCFKYLVDGWSSKNIVYRLRKKKLDDILMDFINEYSRGTGLPNAVVLFYFYPLEEDLNNTGTSCIKLNSYFSKIHIHEFLSCKRKEQFIKDIVTQRINLIDKWCERTRERIIACIIK